MTDLALDATAAPRRSSSKAAPDAVPSTAAAAKPRKGKGSRSRKPDVPDAVASEAATTDGRDAPVEAAPQAEIIQPVATTAAPAPSLDEIATLLIQLDAADLSELIHARNLLQRQAADPELTPEAAPHLVAAAARMGDVLRLEGVEADAALAEVGLLLEQAMNAANGLPVVSVTRPAASAATPNAEHASVAAPAAEVAEMEFDLELLGDFITESREYMEAAEAALLTLEVNPEDTEAINTVFRAFHTLKGTSAFLGLTLIAQLAHHAESLFDRFRNGELRCVGPLADLSLRSVDMMKTLLDSAEELR